MKKIFAFMLIIIMAVSLIGCSKKDNSPNDIKDNTDIVDENSNGENNEEDENKGEVIDPTPNTEKVEVTLYFANKKYAETGDESHRKLMTETRTIEYGNIPLEEAIVKELIKGPESDELSSPIPSSINLLGVEVADGTCYVNFSQEGLYGGSMQEDFTISQIVNSLLELDSVDRVQFLIDGEKAESLMGHFSILEPFEEPFYVE